MLSISCNSVLLQVTNRWKHCYGDNVNNPKKLLMPQGYRGYPHKAWGRTLAATDKVSECHRQKWLNSQASDFHYKECTEVAVTLVFSWLYLSLHTLQVILKMLIFRFADPTLLLTYTRSILIIAHMIHYIIVVNNTYKQRRRYLQSCSSCCWYILIKKLTRR